MIVFDIKRYAINDGPGIRTTVFLKGCPLRCVWCHNPESWLPRPELLFKQQKCIGCNCCGLHPRQREYLTRELRMTNDECRMTNDECRMTNDEYNKPLDSESNSHSSSTISHSSFDNCPTLAFEMCGREMTVDELLAEIEKERDIMTGSGGGVTISGGEPLWRMKNEESRFARNEEYDIPEPEGNSYSSSVIHHSSFEASHSSSVIHHSSFVTRHSQLLSLLHELGLRGFHRAVDTTLYAPAEVVREVAKETDLFLIDLKVMDTEKHKLYTGVSNERILSNIRLVADLGIPFQIRIPTISGINTDDDNIHRAAQFLVSLPSKHIPVNLLPYHEAGKDKHIRRNTTYNPDNIAMATPTDEQLQHIIDLFASYGIEATIGG